METPLRGRSGGHIGTAPTILTRASKLQAMYSRKQGFDDALQAMYVENKASTALSTNAAAKKAIEVLAAAVIPKE